MEDQKPEMDIEDIEDIEEIEDIEFLPYEEIVPDNKIICTILLIAINVIVYWKCTDIPYYSKTGGANYRDIIEGGEYGRLLSHMFLHVDFTHLYYNMIALFLFGKAVEEELGSFKMFLIYFTAGIGSGLFSVYLHHMAEPDGWVNSIGASGAVYALVVAGCFVNIKYVIDSRVKAVLLAGAYILVLVADIVLNKTAGVDFFAHLAGAVIGAVAVILIFCFQKERRSEAFIMKVLGIGLTLLFSLVAVQEAHLGEVPVWNAERIQFIQEAHLDSLSEISYGEALEEFCTETKWNAFFSKQNNEIVEFSGRCEYQGRQEEIEMQFTVDMEEESYQIIYLSLGEESQTKDETLDFLREIFTSYGENHGITVNW